MVRVTQYRAEMAAAVLPRARDAGDALVAGACIRVRQGWLLGRGAERADIDLVEAFSVREDREIAEDAVDMAIARVRLAEIEADPASLVRGAELDARLARWTQG